MLAPLRSLKRLALCVQALYFLPMAQHLALTQPHISDVLVTCPSLPSSVHITTIMQPAVPPSNGSHNHDQQAGSSTQPGLSSASTSADAAAAAAAASSSPSAAAASSAAAGHGSVRPAPVRASGDSPHDDNLREALFPVSFHTSVLESTVMPGAPPPPPGAVPAGRQYRVVARHVNRWTLKEVAEQLLTVPLKQGDVLNLEVRGQNMHA